MANPQTEDGFTKIANELLEAFCKLGLPQNAGQIWFYVLRKTYGWHQKTSFITFEEIQRGTGILKYHISRELKRLIEANMLVTQMGNKKSVSYGIQKDYDKWKLLPKRVTVTQMGFFQSQMGNQKSRKPKSGEAEIIPKDTSLKISNTTAKVKITFNKKTQEFENIEPSLVGVWESKFKELDIKKEIKLAGVWLAGQADNPRGRKKDIKRFLTNWLLGAYGRVKSPKEDPFKMTEEKLKDQA